MAEARKVYVVLDGLRGVAAVAVVTRHMPNFFPHAWLPGSHLAVDLFFILSGFVIAHAYDRRLAEGMSWPAFMRVRLIRLYPVFLLAALIGGPMTVAHHMMNDRPIDYLLVAVPLSLMMIPSPVGPMPYPSVGAAWSLMFELIANFLYALVWKHLTNFRLLLVTIGGAILLVASSLAYNDTDTGFTWATFPGGLGRVLFGFPLGVLMYRLHIAGWRLPRIPALLLIAAMLLAFRAEAVITQLAVILLVLPAIVAAGAYSEAKGVAARLCLFFGALSYAVYLLHIPMARVTGLLAERHTYAQPVMVAAGLLLIAGLLFACWLVDRYFDRPLRRWLLGRPTAERRWVRQRGAR